MTDLAQTAKQLNALRQAHRDLDEEIAKIQIESMSDELTVKRLKKRKLALKDSIALLESAMIPDELA